MLVYVDGGRHGFLLIHLAREPDGHDEVTASMRLMEMWADVAEAFIHCVFHGIPDTVPL